MTCTKSHVRTEREENNRDFAIGGLFTLVVFETLEVPACFTKWYTFRDSTSFPAGNRMKQDFPYNYPFILAESLHLFLLKQLFSRGGVGAGEITARTGGVGGLPGIK